MIYWASSNETPKAIKSIAYHKLNLDNLLMLAIIDDKTENAMLEVFLFIKIV